METQPKNIRSVEEKQKAKLEKAAKLRAKAQLLEESVNKDARKVRDGQLVAFGVLIEEIYKAEPNARVQFTDYAKKYLKDRNLARAVAGFERLSALSMNPVKDAPTQPEAQEAATPEKPFATYAPNILCVCGADITAEAHREFESDGVFYQCSKCKEYTAKQPLPVAR